MTFNDYSPAAIRKLADTITTGMPSATFLGIRGDESHTYGYHRGRDVLSASDYSVQLPADKLGDGAACSALDMGYAGVGLTMITGRLIAAAKAGDPRLRTVREIGGTTDGKITHSYDLATKHEGFGEWDNSHLSHCHLSFYRRDSNNAAALLPVADVIFGRIVTPPTGGTDMSPEESKMLHDLHDRLTKMDLEFFSVLGNATQPGLRTVVGDLSQQSKSNGRALVALANAVSALSAKIDSLPKT